MTDNPWAQPERFDSKAAEWDANAMRAALADAVSRAIIAHMPLSRPENALEFGCGTGLVTLRVAPQCGRVTAIDTSREMVRTLNAKIEADRVPNVQTAVHDLTLPDAAGKLAGNFDFVFSSMTLHHIPDTASFLRQLHDHMADGGTLAIADLDAEDGLFHDDESEKVHHGFDRNVLKQHLEDAGFTSVSFMTAHIVEKKNRAGNRAAYPVFLMTATKPNL